MELIEIVRRNVQEVKASGVTVTANSSQSWVAIDNADNVGILLQGQEADEFNDEVERLWNELGEVTIDEVRAHLAHPYLTILGEM